MLWILLLIILILLSGIAVQDFRERQISAWLLPALLLCATAFVAMRNDWSSIIENFTVNTLLIALQLFTLNIFLSVKYRQRVSLPDRFLGWGDILLLPVAGIFFSPVNMIFFYLLSLAVVCVVFALSNLIQSNQQTTVPLAGGIAVLLAVFLLANETLLKIDSYDNYFLINQLLP